MGNPMNQMHTYGYLILIYILWYMIYPFTLQIDINVQLKSHSYMISFSINLQPYWIYEAFTHFLELSATIKQHTTLRNYNYDLGSLFKDHKKLQLTENGDKIQNETEFLLLFVLFPWNYIVICKKWKTWNNLTALNYLY